MREQQGVALIDRPIGRDDEVQALTRLLDTVAAAHSTVAVLAGDTGTGKSVLVGWAVHEARRRGFTVLQASGVEFEQGLAFSGLTAVVRPLLHRVDRLEPAHARSLRGALGLAEADGRLLAVHGATLALVSAAAEEAPVLVAVDDAQWIDRTSLESLVFAAHRCDADRVGFLFAHRTGLPCMLDRTAFDRIELGGLSCDAAVALLADTGIDAAVAARCWQLTRGNPLALVEAGRNLSPAQRAGDEALPTVLPIGERLLDAFGDELARLPEATRLALGVAALDADDDVAIVAAALGRLGGRLDDLRAAESAGVIEVADQRVWWRHPLVRAAVLHGIDVAGRRGLHRALADAATEAGRPERAVLHLSASVLGPDEDVAKRMAELGAAARRRGALPAAASAYVQAGRLTTDPSARAHYATMAGDAYFALGDHQRALDTVAPLFDQVDDPVARGRMAVVLGSAELWLRGPAVALPRFETNAPAVVDLDPWLHALLMTHAGAARLIALDMPGALAAIRTARVAAESGGDPVLLVAVQACEKVLGLFSGSGADVAGELGRAGDLAVAAYAPGDPKLDSVEGVVQLCAFANYICDDVYAGINLLRHFLHQGEAAGLAGRSMFSRLLLVEGLWRCGWWADALAEMSQLISMQQAVGLGHLVPLSYAVQARVEAGLGLEADCRAHAEEAVATAVGLGIAQIAVWAISGQGLMHLGAGRWEEAAASFDVIADANEVPEPGWLWWQADYIEALWRAGRVDDANAQLDVLEAQAAAVRRTWPTAAVERSSALVGRGGPAEERFAAAIDGFHSISAPFEEARTLLLRGEHRVREGRTSEGARDLAAARTIFDRIGARPWSDRASVARGEAQGGLPSLASRLTAAELRVAMAVGHGASNRQAAEQLFISVKTVDFHLQGIYRKLGVRNRTQLAAIVLANESR
jgi:DNA-binding CsgD family transcriptional regulator